MSGPEHFVHVRRTDGAVKTMNFKGSSVPRVGDRIKLQSATQGIDGEYLVSDVRWMVTNAGSTKNRYVSEAQAEVWVEPPGRTDSRSSLAFILSFVAIVVALATVYLVGHIVGLPWGIP